MTSIASPTPRRSLFACLPDELIETISREVYGDPEDWSLEGSDSLRRLAQVDRRTRRILQPLCWKTLYVTTDAKDFSKLADLLDIYGPLVASMICDISPTAVKSETKIQDLTRSLGRCRQLQDIAFQDDEGHYSQRSDAISAQNVSIARALLPLAAQLRSLSCGGSGAEWADYAPALAVLLPHTTGLQSLFLSIDGFAEQQAVSRVFHDALMRQASLRILVLSEQIFMSVERIDLPRLQHLDLDFDLYDEDEEENLSSLVTSILQSTASTLRYVGIRLPAGMENAARLARSITFPRLESLRLCGNSASVFMFATIKAASSLRTVALCWLETTTPDLVYAFHAKQPTKSLREVVIDDNQYAFDDPDFDVPLARLQVWGASNDVQIVIVNEDDWFAGKLEESQRRAGLRPRFI